MLSTIGAEDLPQLASTLDRVSRSGERALQAAFPASTIVGLFNELRTRLEAQPTLVEVCAPCRTNKAAACCLWSKQTAQKSFRDLAASFVCAQVQPSCPDAKVTVVGDTHGQFHDVVTL